VFSLKGFIWSARFETLGRLWPNSQRRKSALELKKEARKRIDVICVIRLSRLLRLSTLTSLMYTGELKPWKGLVPPSPEIPNDPEILELRKKFEKKRLKNAPEDLDETQMITDIVERLARLEMISRDIENLKTHQKNQDQTLRNLTDWISYLRDDNEGHEYFISDLELTFCLRSGKEELLKKGLEIMEREYGLTYKDGKFVSVEEAHERQNTSRQEQ
jgi:hypothetical protein